MFASASGSSTPRTPTPNAQGVVIWLTGLPASGKTTLSQALHEALASRSLRACLIDGDVLRKGLCQDLGFSEADRQENVRRAGHVASLLASQGLVVIVALVSPYAKDRQRVRECVTSRFLEVHVDCPVQVCQQRDPKGLYARALRGDIADFTGVSAPYEPPVDSDLRIATDSEPVERSSARLLDAVLASLHP